MPRPASELPLALRLMSPDAPLGEPSSEDWENAADFIERNWLQALVHSASRHRSEPIPPALAQDWEAVARDNAFAALRQQQELRDALDILGAAGIEAVALKGAFLAFHGYPQLGARPMSDLDLLFRDQRQALAAFEHLRAHGYSEAFGVEAAVSRKDILSHQLPVLVSPRRIAFDLHWRLGHDDRARHTSDAYWQRTVSRPLLDGTATYPSIEDQAVHLIGHATRQNTLNNGPVVLADLACLFGLAFDADTFARRLSAHGLLRAADPLLELVARLWPAVPVPRPLALPDDERDEGVALVLALFALGAVELKNSRSLDGAGSLAWLRAKLFPTARQLAGAGVADRRAHWKRLLTERLPTMMSSRTLDGLALKREFERWIDRRDG